MKQTFTLIVICLCGLAALAEEPPKPASVKEPELRSELLERTKGDQEARMAFIAWMKEHGTGGMAVTAALSKEKQAEFEKLSGRLKAIDEENTKWLQGVVQKHGWPTTSLAGEDGASAAWLLVQHADADPKFQRKCLDLMARLPKEEVSLSNLAYLTDRVLLAEGKKQRYGTQFTSVDGKWQPRPLEDEANVDERRSQAGLPPLAEYAKLIEQEYGGSPKK
jgi:hypothetical protein